MAARMPTSSPVRATPPPPLAITTALPGPTTIPASTREAPVVRPGTSRLRLLVRIRSPRRRKSEARLLTRSVIRFARRTIRSMSLGGRECAVAQSLMS